MLEPQYSALCAPFTGWAHGPCAMSAGSSCQGGCYVNVVDRSNAIGRNAIGRNAMELLRWVAFGRVSAVADTDA